MKARPAPFRLQLCRTHLAGGCSFGNRCARGSGFTLLELLLTLGLAAALAGFLMTERRPADATVLRSAQATLVNVILTARSRAMATGRRVRILVNVDPGKADRCRRQLAWQEESDPGDWTTIGTAIFPGGAYVVPYKMRVPAGIFPDPEAWRRTGSQEPLASSALSAAPVAAEISGAGAETWESITFTATGTPSANGYVLVALGRPRLPGADGPASPVVLDEPEKIRGVLLTVYGLPRRIDSRASVQ